MPIGTELISCHIPQEDGYQAWRKSAIDAVTSNGTLEYRSKHARFSDLYFIHKYLSGSPHNKMLELGAWPTYLFLSFASISDELVVSDSMQWNSERKLGDVDVSPTSWLNECNGIFPHVRGEVIDACDIPYEGYFDCVYSVSVLEHIKDDMAALKSMRRALRPGGQLILTTEVNLFTSMDYQPDIYMRVYQADELIDLVESAGFRVSKDVLYADNQKIIDLMTPAIDNPSLLRHPYRHFVSCGISCEKI